MLRKRNQQARLDEDMEVDKALQGLENTTITKRSREEA